MQRLLITLRREDAGGFSVVVTSGMERCGEALFPSLPAALAAAHDQFLLGASLEEELLELGRELGALALPNSSASVLAKMIEDDSCIEICIESDDSKLLALPFEAMRLNDGLLLVTHEAVVMTRRPMGLAAPVAGELAGPLKILVAIGAPDEDKSDEAVLDQERELQNILDAVEATRRDEEFGVRILEVGNPDVIAAALALDDYHLLHISCHGAPGALVLEDEEGRPVLVTADDLVEPIRRSGKALPIVMLNTCHGGVHDRQTASLAVQLLRAGVPAVVAMQTSVSDAYATNLAHAFYRHLAGTQLPLASRALAAARRELEQDRLAARARRTPGIATMPEYATATCFVAGEESAVANFALEKRPLRIRPVFEAPGPVPQLRIDDLIGRRAELRRALQALRDGAPGGAGVLLTGIGGIGKSAIAGRIMQRLLEDGWAVAATSGQFDVAATATAIAEALTTLGSTRGNELSPADLDDETRLRLMSDALGDTPLLLVLDDFEQNLVQGGGAFLNPNIASYFETLADSARRGKMLIASRYPVPEPSESKFQRIAVGPLSTEQTRKLLLRLPALNASLTGDAGFILRTIGGHPRMLELVDALLRGGEARLPAVARKLSELLAVVETPVDLEDALNAALTAGVRDVFLTELLALAHIHGAHEVLLQTAVSNIAVSAASLAEMIGNDEETVNGALQLLANLSLVHRSHDGSAWVHRWTAEGLAQLEGEETHIFLCRRAAIYRWEHSSNANDLTNAVEAVRNAMAAHEYDVAIAVAERCFERMRTLNQSTSIAALASEMLGVLPTEHRALSIADAEAAAHVALGFTDRALARYTALLEQIERLAADPTRRPSVLGDFAIMQVKIGDLRRRMGESDSVRELYASALVAFDEFLRDNPREVLMQRARAGLRSKMGDLYKSLGKGDEARESYVESLAAFRRLALEEPDNTELQREVALAWNRISETHADRGEFDLARRAQNQSRQIREDLLEADPDNSDRKRDVSVILERLGYFHEQLGDSAGAYDAYERSLRLREAVWNGEPDRSDHQRELSVGYEHFADLCKSLGKIEEARQAYMKSLALMRRIAAAEPTRADFQRDLAITYIKTGNFFSFVGSKESPRQAYVQALKIFRSLVAAEPHREDYEHELSLALTNIGDEDVADDKYDDALHVFSEALEIRERLSRAQPERRDRRRELSVIHSRLAGVHGLRGKWELAAEYYRTAVTIDEGLVAEEPHRIDLLRDLASDIERLGDVAMALENAAEACQSYERGLAVYERTAAVDPNRLEHRAGLASIHHRLAWAYLSVGRHEEGKLAYAAALEIAKRTSREHPDIAVHHQHLQQIADDYLQFLWRLGDVQGTYDVSLQALEARQWLANASSDNDLLYGLAHFHGQFANVCRVAGKLEEMSRTYAAAIAILETLRERDPADLEYQHDLVKNYLAATKLHHELGQEEEEFRSTLRAVVTNERLGDAEQVSTSMLTDIVLSYLTLGGIAHNARKVKLAITLMERALAVCQKMMAADPEDPRHDGTLSALYILLGDLYRDSERPQDARVVYQGAVAIHQRKMTATEDLAAAYEHLGTLREVFPDDVEVGAAYQQSLTIREELAASDPEDVEHQIHLSVALARTGSRKCLERARSILIGLRDTGRLPADQHDFIEGVERALQ